MVYIVLKVFIVILSKYIRTTGFLEQMCRQFRRDLWLTIVIIITDHQSQVYIKPNSVSIYHYSVSRIDDKQKILKNYKCPIIHFVVISQIPLRPNYFTDDLIEGVFAYEFLLKC